MAKGWESKSVEAQIEAAENQVRRRPQNPPLDLARIEMLRKKENLILSRTRVLRDLESSVNPRYQAMLQRALADLDAQIAALEPKRSAAAHA
jgi:hypothetical protein